MSDKMNNTNSLNVYQVAGEILDKLKRNGTFDGFRKDCLADVDSKPAFQTLRYRVEGAVTRFLESQRWHASLNKNQLRESLRKHIVSSSFLPSGVDDIVNQVVRSKLSRLIKPQIDSVVQDVLAEPSSSNDRASEAKEKENNSVHRQKVEPLTVEDLLNVSVPLEDKANTAKHGTNGATAQAAVVQSDMDQTVDMDIDESEDSASDIQLPPDEGEALITSDGDIMYVVDEVEEEVYEEGAEEMVEEAYAMSAALHDNQHGASEETKVENETDKQPSQWHSWNSTSSRSVGSHTSDPSSGDDDNRSQEDNDDRATEGEEVCTDTEQTSGRSSRKDMSDSTKQLIAESQHKRRARRALRKSHSSHMPEEENGGKVGKKRDQLSEKLQEKKRDRRRRMSEEEIKAVEESQVVEFNAYVSTVNTVEDGMETVTVELIGDSQSFDEPDDSSCSSGENNLTQLSPDITHTKSHDKGLYSRSQRYDESDLYKPHLHSSRTRSRPADDNCSALPQDNSGVTHTSDDLVSATDYNKAKQPEQNVDDFGRHVSDSARISRHTRSSKVLEGMPNVRPQDEQATNKEICEIEKQRIEAGKPSGWADESMDGKQPSSCLDDCDTSKRASNHDMSEHNTTQHNARSSRNKRTSSPSDLQHKRGLEKMISDSGDRERRSRRQQGKRSGEHEQDSTEELSEQNKGSSGVEQHDCTLEEGEARESAIRRRVTAQRRVARKQTENSSKEDGELKSQASSPQTVEKPTASGCEVIGWIEDCYDSPKDLTHASSTGVHNEEQGELRQDDQLSTEELNANSSETGQSAEWDEEGSEKDDDSAKQHDDIDVNADVVEHATRSRRSKPQVMTRSVRKQSQEVLLPPAKRLRSSNK